MMTVFVYAGGETRRTDQVDPAWLAPGASEILWVDIEEPEEAERHLLADVFKFHELAIEDALTELHPPKIESYDSYLYLILHGIAPSEDRGGFVTQDVDFFLGRNYLVTLHHQKSRSIDRELEVCGRRPEVLGEGAPSVLHRIIDAMVDHYRPEVDALEDRLEDIERVVFEQPRTNPLRDILSLKRDVASLRRVTLPERDAVGRLARREFPQIPDELMYRFRDVYDHLVRLTDEAISFQDRVTSLLDAYLSSQSNRLNQVMKVLTVITTVFLPPTLLTGMYGMNVDLPHLPVHGSAEFWCLLALMVVVSGGMLWAFRRMEWL